MNKSQILLFFILSSYVGFCFYRVPTLADGIVVGVIASLFGWGQYMEYNKKEDPSEELLARIKDCEEKISSINLTDSSTGIRNVKREKQNFQW